MKTIKSCGLFVLIVNHKLRLHLGTYQASVTAMATSVAIEYWFWLLNPLWAEPNYLIHDMPSSWHCVEANFNLPGTGRPAKTKDVKEQEWSLSENIIKRWHFTENSY